MIKVISYEERVAQMKQPKDVDKQIKLARYYVQRLCKRAKAANLLADKIELQKAVTEAESVLRNLISSVFDLEDMLNAQEVSA